MEIRFLSVGCGDGICIRFFGEDGSYHNILIDGGTEKGDKYERSLKKEIIAINERKEKIDLWIITHIDDDHIGGILRFVKDQALFKEIDLSATRFWFNYSDVDYDTGISPDNFKSVKQGIRLRELLKQKAFLQQFITDELQVINFFGVKFSILSPNRQKFEDLALEWKKEEIKIIEKNAASFKGTEENDHETKIEDFDLELEESDTSTANASSIAFILEYKAKKLLFTADAHPHILENAMSQLGYSDENKLYVEYMQVPHHGSKFNTSDGLLKMISCFNYIISADGFKHNLPNKKALARIIKFNKEKATNFFITEMNSVTRSIFSVDGILENVTLNFPSEGTGGLVFNL
jgi:beta-lactamase superfamily II metal-dependent hydrolase